MFLRIRPEDITLLDLVCINLNPPFLRANASLNLESQINKVDGLVSGFERKLSDDGPVPDLPNALQSSLEEIQVKKKINKSAQGKQSVSQSVTQRQLSIHYNLRVSFVVFSFRRSLWQQLRVT